MDMITIKNWSRLFLSQELGSLFFYTLSLSLVALAVCLCDVVAILDDEILRPVVVLAGEVAGENGLGAIGVALLRIQRGTRDMGNHGVAATPGVLSVAQRVVLGGGLGEPDITTVALEVAGLQGVSDVLLDDDSATSRVDEP